MLPQLPHIIDIVILYKTYRPSQKTLPTDLEYQKFKSQNSEFWPFYPSLKELTKNKRIKFVAQYLYFPNFY